MSARTFDLNKAKKYGNVQVKHTLNQLSQLIMTVTLYETVVVAYNSVTRELVLNSGGYHSRTTMTAINTALRQIRQFEHIGVFQRRGAWYVGSDRVKTYRFRDGLALGDIAGLIVELDTSEAA